jgi:hypothetical protein
MFGRQQQKRSAPRLPSFGRAEILDAEGRPIHQCVVKEISRTGAYIIPDDPKTLPDVCQIWIPHLELKVTAHVRWRKKGGVGLEFVKPIAASRLVETGKGWETGT